MTRFWLLALLGTLLGCSPLQPTSASQPADNLLRTTFETLLARQASLLHAPSQTFVKLSLDAEDRPYLVPARYLGERHPVADRHWDVIQLWGRATRQPLELTTPYREEITVAGDRHRYRVALRADMADSMAQALQPGSSIRLALLLVGSIRSADESVMEPVFLVTRYWRE